MKPLSNVSSYLFIYHHGLWLFRRILNIVIILAVMQARQIVAIVQARQIGESKSSVESEVSVPDFPNILEG